MEEGFDVALNAQSRDETVAFKLLLSSSLNAVLELCCSTQLTSMLPTLNRPCRRAVSLSI